VDVGIETVVSEGCSSDEIMLEPLVTPNSGGGRVRPVLLERVSVLCPSPVPANRSRTRIVWLPGGEKFLMTRLFVLTELTNVTDRHTDRQTDTT